jgi:ribosomal protein L24
MINHGDFVRIDEGIDTGKIGQVVSVSDKFVTVNVGRIKTFSLYTVHKVEIKTILMLLNERGLQS